MPDFDELAALLAVVTFAGSAADWFVRDTQRSKTYDALVRFWDWLDDVEIPNAARASCHAMRRGLESAFPSSPWSVGTLGRALLASFVLTLVALILGHWIDGQAYVTDPSRWPAAYVFLVNFLFDALTVAVAAIAIREVEAASAWRGLLALLVALLVALLLSVLVLVAVDTIANLWARLGLDGHNRARWAASAMQVTYPDKFEILAEQGATFWRVDSSPIELLGRIRNLVVRVAGGTYQGHVFIVEAHLPSGVVNAYPISVTLGVNDLGADALLYSMTTLIPVSIIVTLIVSLLVGKALLGASRAVLLFVVEAGTERAAQSPAAFLPGTFAGVLSGIVLCLGWLLVSILRGVLK